jgi:hypothetical protein
MVRSLPGPQLTSVTGGYCGYRERSAAPVRRREVPAGAAKCGYADHSHLVREFQDLAGCTPSELLATRTTEAGYPATV